MLWYSIILQKLYRPKKQLPQYPFSLPIFRSSIKNYSSGIVTFYEVFKKFEVCMANYGKIEI